MNVNYYLSPYPALLEGMVAIIYEVDLNGGTAEVDRIDIPERNGAGVPTPGAGHQVPFHVYFSGLDLITHEVKLLTASATLLHKYDVTPVADTVSIFDPIRFKIGDGGTYTPAAGDNQYVNPNMAALADTDYIAIRTGYGPLIEGVHIANNIAGGFGLLQSGDIWGDEEEVTIIITTKVVPVYVNDSVVGKVWGPTAGNADMFVDVNSSVDYAPTHLRKLIRLSGNTAAYHFTALVPPPVGYIFRFTNVGAYVLITDTPIVYFDNAPLISGNTTVASFSMPFGSTCEFVFDGTNWNKSISFAAPYTAIIGAPQFYRGLVAVGDVSGDKVITVTIPNQGTADYHVSPTIISNNNIFFDNDVWCCVKDRTATSFKLGFQELGGATQNISVDYLITKL